MAKLTVRGVEATTKPGRYGDGGTLFLHVAPGGSKSWVQRVTIDGQRRDIGLGGFPVVSLAKARRRAFDNRVAISDGLNPVAEKRAKKRKATIPTFREAAAQTFEANKHRWRNDKHVKNWMQSLERYAFTVVGDMPVDRIGRGRCPAHSHADMDKPARDCPPTSATYPRCPALVRGSRVHRAQRGGRRDRRRVAGHAETQGAFSRSALSGSSRGA